MSELSLHKFQDEDKIEKTLDKLHNVAFNNVPLDNDLINEINFILGVWDKYLGNKKLSDYIRNNFLNTMKNSNILITLELVICFFQHYIYAFDEFMNRKYRNCVWRCGLTCERIVKRLLILSKETLYLDDKYSFEDRVGRLQGVLSGDIADMLFLAYFLRYVYSNRSKRAAHDTKVADEILAKQNITQLPTIYYLYLQSLEWFKISVPEKETLIELVNTTIQTNTTMVVSKEGKTPDIDTVVKNLFINRIFVSEGRSLKETIDILSKKGMNYPKTTVFKGLERAYKKFKYLQKLKGKYFERLPPSEFVK